MTVTNFTLDLVAPHGLLGVWTEREPAADVAFSGSDHGSQPADDEVSWCVDLATHPTTAARTLALARAELRETHDLLDEVGDVVAAVAHRAELDRDLEADVAFDVSEPRSAPSRAAIDAIDRLVSAIAPTSWVETSCDGRVQGRSRTTIGGGVSTVLLDDRAAARRLHGEALDLAAASRITALQMLAVVTRGAVAIAVRLGLPGGPIVALPLAWRSLQAILEVSRRSVGQGTPP